MPIGKDTITNSEVTYHILRELLKDEKTPTELSEGLETSSQSINNYLKRLMDFDVVKKAEKQGRKQPYTTDIDNLQDFLKELFGNYIEDLDIPEDVIETELDMYDAFTDYNIRQGIERDYKIVLFEFVDNYLSMIEHSTIEEMFEAFLDGLEMSNIEDLNVEWLHGLKAISKKRHSFVTDPEQLFDNAVKSYKKYPDTIEKQNSYLLHDADKEQLIELDTERIRNCPECKEQLPEDFRFARQETNECPSCGETIEKPSYSTKYICPDCGEEIPEPEHGEETDCGCGRIMNEAENKKEVQEFMEEQD